MSWDINERFEVERQVVRAICRQIARGTLPPGHAMPPPHVLAQERVLNPRVVESAYATLVEVGLLLAPSGDAYQIADDAQRLARVWLLQCAEQELREMVSALRRDGLSTEEIRRVFREVDDV